MDGASAVTRAFARSPLKLLVPRPRGPAAWAFTSSHGGGVVAGDETSLEVVVGPGACAYVGTQSLSKVYRNPEGRPCGHRVLARVGESGLLVWLPDPTQLFSEARYRQRVEVDMDAGASLVLLDSFTPGRVACGESWRFSHYTSSTRVRVGGRKVLWETVRLDPADGPLGTPFRGGVYGCHATLVLLGPRVADLAGGILSEVAGLPVVPRAVRLVSAGRLADGLLLRLAEVNAETLWACLRRWLGGLADELGDDPWQRKW